MSNYYSSNGYDGSSNYSGSYDAGYDSSYYDSPGQNAYAKDVNSNFESYGTHVPQLPNSSSSGAYEAHGYGNLPSIPDEIKGSYTMAQIAAFKANLRAGYTKQAMDNTAALSAIEEKCKKLAPSGSAEYHALVRAYAYKSCQIIIGGDW